MGAPRVEQADADEGQDARASQRSDPGHVALEVAVAHQVPLAVSLLIDATTAFT